MRLRRHPETTRALPARQESYLEIGAMRDRFRVLMVGLALLLASTPAAHAEQKEVIGDFEAHYVVFPSTFLSAEVADAYGITRARNLSIVNLSVLDSAGDGTPAGLAGQVKNLLGQQSPLKFREIREDKALYYIAEVRHADREVLRFTIAVTPPGERTFDLSFQQELFWDE